MNSTFNGHLSFLNARVEKIDELIKAGSYKDALSVIEEVLEWAPRSGELYWKKVLAKQECKDHAELLHKGGVLQNITAFVNIKEFADKDEPVYKLITDVEKADVIIKTQLKKALDNKEFKEKQNTKAKDQLVEFQQSLSQVKKTAQENINRLESVEKSIHEQVIDCIAISNEYKSALNAVCSVAAELQDDFKNKDFMRYEEKIDAEFQVDMILAESDTDVSLLKQVEKHTTFLEYSKLLGKRQPFVDEIKKNISDIHRIQSEINGLVDSLKKITCKYENAREAISVGSYNLAKTILSQRDVEEIINQALMPVKAIK